MQGAANELNIYFASAIVEIGPNRELETKLLFNSGGVVVGLTRSREKNLAGPQHATKHVTGGESPVYVSGERGHNLRGMSFPGRTSGRRI